MPNCSKTIFIQISYTPNILHMYIYSMKSIGFDLLYITLVFWWCLLLTGHGSGEWEESVWTGCPDCLSEVQVTVLSAESQGKYM